STGYRTDIGLQILPRRILSGEIYAGYLSQIYNVSSSGSIGPGGRAPPVTRSPGSSSISGFDAGGRLVYNVTRLTTATFTGLRTVIPSNPTINNTGTSYLATTAAANVDHELLRNLLLNASAGYEIDNYLGISRTDNILSVGADLKYLLNRNLFLGGSYAYQKRNSTAAGGSYTQNILMVRLGAQF
ncbi:MAG: outer membrane beta-barrel protein, partial [Hyphomicrobiales bacterium]|nr:outer membrane beta-barrel protein [Hyphomicrobiales bacterium]